MAQTSDVLSLTWQWGGQAVHRTVIAVSHVGKEGGGWFGISQSPSIAGNVPNAMIVDGEVVPGAGEPGAVKLKIPGQELPPVKAGGQLAISYTEDLRAVCVAVPPVGLSGEALAAWLTDWRCQPGM